jgi:hypothetical protein
MVVLFRPLHDALLEDSLGKASISLGEPVQEPVRWSPYVKILRSILGLATAIIHAPGSSRPRPRREDKQKNIYQPRKEKL